mgnify:CR=1 FL=1
MLVAIVDEKWMTLSGDATESLGAVEIVHADGTLTVEDNDILGTLVPITGDDPSGVMHIDASEVTGAGVYIVSEHEGVSKIIATELDDVIISGAGIRATILSMADTGSIRSPSGAILPNIPFR